MKKIPDFIYQSISKEMKIFEKKFYKIMENELLLLNNIINYIKSNKGKQIRPIFVFLIAKMLGTISKKTYDMASLVELIHTGTIIHDDVVDNSNIRRGFYSIRKIWNNKIAVLVGDYFLSKSILLATNHKHYDLLKIISNTIANMSKGELLQIEKTKKLYINENYYNKIITYKTASLISACCEGAARSINSDEKTALKMSKFGNFIGMAFQIKDDIFDYELNQSINKPTGGIDIKEKKITLPLIYTIQHSSSKRKKWIIDIINNKNNSKEINDVILYVKDFGGIDYANKKMIFLKKKALNIIKIYPDSKAKKSLKMMLNFIIQRKN